MIVEDPKKCPRCGSVMDYLGKGESPFPWIGGKWDAWICASCDSVLNTKKPTEPGKESA